MELHNKIKEAQFDISDKLLIRYKKGYGFWIHKEIENGEIMRNRWFWSFFYHYSPLQNPEELNPFISNLMDPFKYSSNKTAENINCDSYNSTINSPTNNIIRSRTLSNVNNIV